MSAPTFVTDRLDQLEAALPAIPARIVRLQRSVYANAYDRTVTVVSALTDTTKNFFETARVSGKTVTGQARAASADVLDTARTGFATVSGQTKAQGRKVAKTGSRDVKGLLDSAVDAVTDDAAAPGSGTPYEQWTKADLLERAKELNLEGRTGLNKKQLIAKLRSA